MSKSLGFTLFKISMAVIFLVTSTGQASAAEQQGGVAQNTIRNPPLAQESLECNLGVARTFSANFERVFAAGLEVLEEMQEPSALADPARGLINTGAVSVDNQRLKEIIAEEYLEFLGPREGRYLLSLCLEAVGAETTQVTVTPLIIVNTRFAESPIGGRPIPSNGTLEAEHLDAIAEMLEGDIPPIPRAVENCCELDSSPFSHLANVQVNQVDHNSSILGNSTTQSETSLAVFGSTIVMGWNDSSDFASGIGGLESFMGFGFSTDGGTTFTDAGLFAPAPSFRNIGDPSLAVDRAGNFYIASLTDNPMTGESRIAVAQSTSISPVVSFGAPVLIPGLLPFGFQDKELIAVDTTGGAFDGRVYVTWSEFGFTNDTTILFAGSTTTTPLAFSAPIALSPTDALNQGAMPAVGPSGEVYVAWGRFEFSVGGITAQSIRLLRSNDGGVTFVNPDPADPAPAKTVASPTPAPDFMTTGGPLERISRTRGFPYIAVDNTPAGSPTHGNVYIVFQADPDGAGTDLSDIFFTRSTDGGATWSTPVSINAGAAVTTNPDTTTNDNWQPSIAVSPGSGDIAVTFYDRRNDTTSTDGDPPNTQVTLFRSVSRDGGLTWSNEHVADVAFIPSTRYDPVINPTYMGDYNYTVADASNFYMTWGDTRNLCTPPPGALNPCSPVGRGDQDVFYAQEPIHSDLTITKTDSPDPVTPGQNLTYDLTITNNGASASTAVEVTDTLPAEVTFVSATPSQGACSEAAGVVTCELGHLANGTSVMVTIDVTVNTTVICGASLLNTAVIEGNVSDPNLADNSASADTTVTCAVGLDIRPEAFPNRIRLDGPRLVHVAILSSPSFDAPNDVDRASLTFGHSGDENSLHRQGRDCWRNDVNHDGLLDLVCNFVLRRTGFLLSDTIGILKGLLLDGTSFEAQDSVVIIE
jgi:uncharacterized repeat protein (TIGR01451 family)